MKIKFDSDQKYQEDAVASIVGLFEGQPQQGDDYTVAISTAVSTGQSSIFQAELGIGNNIRIAEDILYANLCAVQEQNDLDAVSREVFDRHGMNFSVEMETGTGKTYVYLRTIFELSQKYGFKKFIIVVPSVPIREGTLKNLEITADHFKALYNNIPFQHFVYDSKKAARLRQFATSNQLEIMVINIDAFRKDFSDSEDERKSNVIFKESDKLSGRKPIEFVQSTRPFVIIDEPQSVDNTPRAQDAIKSLAPACIFRFSATHKNPYNLVYKLDPIRAYELRLVKQIVVASVQGKDAQNAAYVKLLDVDNKKGIRARIKLHVQAAGKVTEKEIWVKQGHDLYAISNERETYRNGYEVTDISAEPGNQFIDFNSGRLNLGQERGGIQEDLVEVQIRKTIQKHLDKELQLQGRGIKVLSLFFIDRVANYRSYDADGKAVKGPYAELFEKHYSELLRLPQYATLEKLPVGQVHNGYFSDDKRAITPFEEVKGKTNKDAEESTYNLIMRDKERLLSMDEPLKFIFSHSALREGWDNPNVFQICMLREVGSLKERRQTLGRGLRLPVNSEGERVWDEGINKLTVIATESYTDFAEGLQKEYEDDCGVTFGKVPKGAFTHIQTVVEGETKELDKEASMQIQTALIAAGFMDEGGKIKASFQPQNTGFTLNLPNEYKPFEAEIIARLQSYQLERHIKNEEEPRPLKPKKQALLDPDFVALWERIKYRTTYEVNYDTAKLIEAASEAIRKMERIEAVQVTYKEAQLELENKGITAQETRVNYHTVAFTGELPDVVAYIQKETELTRRTIVDILVKSGKLNQFLLNPQKFMDAVAAVIGRELHKMMIDGIKYERISEEEWSMREFEEKEILSYLYNRLEVSKSVYDAIVYDSEVERKFAEGLEAREDIKLFVKLPSWFKVETPVGTYNPDWAIVKHEDETIYLVRETKATRDYEKLRNVEADKIRCGRRHFEALGTDFNVITTASEV